MVEEVLNVAEPERTKRIAMEMMKKMWIRVLLNKLAEAKWDNYVFSRKDMI